MKSGRLVYMNGDFVPEHDADDEYENATHINMLGPRAGKGRHKKYNSLPRINNRTREAQQKQQHGNPQDVRNGQGPRPRGNMRAGTKADDPCNVM